MAENKEKSKLRRLLGGLGGFALTLILAAVIYLAAVLLQTPGAQEEASFVVREEPETVTRMQSASMQDARALAQLFESPLPALPNAVPNGQAVNTRHDGQTVRKVTLDYGSLVINAVRPASAAPLLLRGELDLSLRSDLTVLNLPATLACRDGAWCLYFSDETAAYSLYAPKAEEAEFLSLPASIQWVR